MPEPLPGVGPIPAGVLSTGMEWVLGGGVIVLAAVVVYLFRELRQQWQESAQHSLAQQREYHALVTKVDQTLEKLSAMLQALTRR